ncbi:protein of unknown function [Pseudomonas putida KT2440]|jgi:hypothetical protein|uniref:Uncharacterized protein n=1 Tax=Pseudomonas putida (strain ATCC 47054 / DSM 6125 / CFBP 8728 / NCIMB 11950 / KT2440) TaxID=160488 RepID=A0A140FW10_PSEPK|nr:protein of unknown function [Pseudomonas putida KT2440]
MGQKWCPLLGGHHGLRRFRQEDVLAGRIPGFDYQGSVSFFVYGTRHFQCFDTCLLTADAVKPNRADASTKLPVSPLPQMLPCKATYQHDFCKIDLIVHYYEHSYLQARSEKYAIGTLPQKSTIYIPKKMSRGLWCSSEHQTGFIDLKPDIRALPCTRLL